MWRVLGAGFLHLHGAWYPQLPDVRERLSADGQAERGAGGPVLPRYGADGGVQRTGGQFACIYSIPYLIRRPLRVVQRTICEKKNVSYLFLYSSESQVYSCRLSFGVPYYCCLSMMVPTLLLPSICLTVYFRTKLSFVDAL